MLYRIYFFLKGQYFHIERELQTAYYGDKTEALQIVMNETGAAESEIELQWIEAVE